MLYTVNDCLPMSCLKYHSCLRKVSLIKLDTVWLEKKKRNEKINIRIYHKERSMKICKDLSTRIFMALITIVETWKIEQGLILKEYENYFYGTLIKVCIIHT